MLELKTRESLADAARTLAGSFNLVNYMSHIYLPVDYITGEPAPPPAPERTVWRQLDLGAIQRLAASSLNVLFANDTELVNFRLMLLQLAEWHGRPATSILMNRGGRLQVFEEGSYRSFYGTFHPNYLETPVNDSDEDKDFVWKTIVGWLNSEEEAVSLLRHVATALLPEYSAVKYVLLLGEGRNGKGVFLHMLKDLFGENNVSDVTRQQMAAGSPVCPELNGKLLNIVMDGPMEYIKDSGMEKTLIAGETASVRRLFESQLTPVQTNGLFLEGLNNEPKTRDKSSALQKRLARFWFPNIYELDLLFSAEMRSPENLGALLALLIDHFVMPDEFATKLAPTQESQALQLDQMILNSIPLQFLEYLFEQDVAYVDKTLDTDVAALLGSFIPWAHAQHGTLFADADALKAFRPLLDLKRTSRRNKTPRNYWKVAGYKNDAALLADRVREEAQRAADAVVVDAEGAVQT